MFKRRRQRFIAPAPLPLASEAAPALLFSKRELDTYNRLLPTTQGDDCSLRSLDDWIAETLVRLNKEL